MMKTNNLKVVIDTNVLLVTISPYSKYHWVFEMLVKGDFEMYITNEILLEYNEIISNRYSSETVMNLFETLLTLPNVHQIIPHFKWNIIKQDPDDNKFIDCALNAGANLIITHDRHFDIVKEISFPSINICTIDEFKSLIDEW